MFAIAAARIPSKALVEFGVGDTEGPGIGDGDGVAVNFETTSIEKTIEFARNRLLSPTDALSKHFPAELNFTKYESKTVHTDCVCDSSKYPAIDSVRIAKPVSVPTSYFVKLGSVITSGRRVSVGEGVGDGVTEGLGVGVATFTPLLHTSLVPDLIQVYLIPNEILVELTLVQVDPGFTAAFEGATNCMSNIEKHSNPIRRRFIGKL